MRDVILEAAIDVIGEVGWGQATTRKIADRAGVNNALIHYYFGSKDVLLRTAVISLFTSELEAPLTALLQCEDIHSGIDAMFEGIETLDTSDTRLVVASEAMVQGLRDEEIRRWIQQLLDESGRELGRRIEEGQAAGRVRPDLDAAGAALLLVGMLDALVLYRFNHPTLDLEPSRRAMHTMFGREEDDT